MNGYELTDKLRKTRRRHRLTAPTQALYYELVAICNEEGWPDEFKCSNDELCSALQVSEKSLIAYRQELIQAGLLYYMSGKSKKKVGIYSFVKEFLNGCKFYNQSDSLTVSQLGSQSVSQSGEKPPDLIKTKKETELIKKPAGEKEIADVQVGATVEFCAITLHRNYSKDRVKELWRAFIIQNSEEVYPREGERIKHFRNWIKTQPYDKKDPSQQNRQTSGINPQAVKMLLKNE